MRIAVIFCSSWFLLLPSALFAQAAEPAELADAHSVELLVNKRYLQLPVKTGATKSRMALIVDDQTVREFTIEFETKEPDFWVFVDVGPWKGQKLVVQADPLPADSDALASITQSDTAVRDPDRLYRERLRPQFHFTSRRGWNNDPNGLVYYQGEYHLYYQHNPYGWSWGNMHWGHAVSNDLVHWRELPIAIYPHQFGDWAFSGGALVDRNNTAGFKTGKEDVIVASYTSTGRGECIAYSNDRGRTFQEYDGNPVVRHRGRDPKIIWHEPTQRWVMAVYDEHEEKRWIAFYTSKDLKAWQFASRLEGYYECPEIFELPVDDGDTKKWVVYAADGNYAIGAFDGQVFTTESGKHPFNYGNCFYASQTYSDIPESDGRRIQIGWGRVATPGMPFNQMMLFPCSLTLKTTDEGIRMFAYPVREVSQLRKGQVAWANKPIEDEVVAVEVEGRDLYDIDLECESHGASKFGVNIRGIRVQYDVQKQTLTCRDKSAPLKPLPTEAGDSRIRLRVLVDRTSIEVFGNDGRVYMPMGVIPPEDNHTLEFFSEEGQTLVKSLVVHQLESVW